MLVKTLTICWTERVGLTLEPSIEGEVTEQQQEFKCGQCPTY